MAGHIYDVLHNYVAIVTTSVATNFCDDDPDKSLWPFVKSYLVVHIMRQIMW
jgi:hypothetical protein